MTPTFDVVIPTTGRRSLSTVLERLGRVPGRVIVVDDRRDTSSPLYVPNGVKVVSSGGCGPAAARNVGWRTASAEFVAFLDDDVVPPPDWPDRLAEDLDACGPDVGGTQGQIEVPLPPDRRPTDWERNVAGLASARWATADLAYRRSVLVEVGGFDERFPRAYREDADLGLRITAAGWRIVQGRRWVAHPVRPAPWHVSVGKQRGNADDARMARIHGRGWRARAGAPAGTRRRHIAVTVLALVAGVTRSRLAALAWAAATAELAWRRIAPGPRTPAEVAAMVATSAVIPPAATLAWARGMVEHLAPAAPSRPAVQAVLLDRDATLVADVPYNGDPARVVPVAGALAALDRLRAAGLPLAVVSNQSGVARGLVTRAQVEAVNGRVEDLLGPFAAVIVCPHGPDDGCECRKPQPGMIQKAAFELGVDPTACVVIGDIGADVEAALAAGARAILVPTPVTRPEEVAAAPVVAPDLAAAVDLVLDGSV